MEVDRRHFLKIAGLIGLGIAVKPVLDLLSPVGAANELAISGSQGTKRLAMVVDLNELEKSKDVIKAGIEECHRIHNVPDLEKAFARGEISEEVKIRQELKWIWTVDHEGAFAEQGHEFTEKYLKQSLGSEHLAIPILCNHCDNPPCVRVCPTQATFKRGEDGIVIMDYHRCIGCRFCMAACPYGARSFNWRDPRDFIDKKDITPNFPTRSKGVVEKCNFCAERLIKGLKPACVQVCEDNGCKALVFGDLHDENEEVRHLVTSRYSIRRKPELGTEPSIYYLI